MLFMGLSQFTDKQLAAEIDYLELVFENLAFELGGGAGLLSNPAILRFGNAVGANLL